MTIVKNVENDENESEIEIWARNEILKIADSVAGKTYLFNVNTKGKVPHQNKEISNVYNKYVEQAHKLVEKWSNLEP